MNMISDSPDSQNKKLNGYTHLKTILYYFGGWWTVPFNDGKVYIQMDKGKDTCSPIFAFLARWVTTNTCRVPGFSWLFVSLGLTWRPRNTVSEVTSCQRVACETKWVTVTSHQRGLDLTHAILPLIEAWSIRPWKWHIAVPTYVPVRAGSQEKGGNTCTVMRGRTFDMSNIRALHVEVKFQQMVSVAAISAKSL